jgi:hypothetical protein
LIFIEPIQWTPGTDPNSAQLNLGGSPYWVQTAGQAWSMTNPGGDNTTLRFEVRPGDMWSSDKHAVERSEISGATVYAPGAPIRISYEWTVEPGQTNDAKWLVAGQLHTVVSNGISPPFAIYMTGDRMKIRVDEAGGAPNAFSYYKTIYTDPQDIIRGHAYAMRIDVNFDAANGYVKVVRDGVVLADYRGPLGYTNMGPVYWKEGVYRASSSAPIAMNYSRLSISGRAATTAAPATAASPPTLARDDGPARATP